MSENLVKETLLHSITVEATEYSVNVCVPKFFAATGDDLSLTFYYSGRVFYVHDNGGALNQLKKRINDTQELERTVKKVGANVSFDGEETVGAFCQVHTFFHYLQILVFVANADLYCDNLDEDGLRYDSDIILPSVESREKLNSDELLKIIDEGILCRLNDDGSYRFSLAMFYSTFSTFTSYKVELNDLTVRITDFLKGNIEGEIFESFYWDHDDIGKYADEINRYCQRFGVGFDGKDIFITDSAENLYIALMRFFNAAVLLSELGNLIDLPKDR